MEFPCIEIPPLPDPLQLTLPGGVTIERINLAEVIQPALAPLVPIFEIVDTVVSVFNCIKAIPDMFGPPPDPTVLVSALAELGQKVSNLLKLIPQLSLPLTLVGLLDLVLDTLGQARAQLVHLQQQMQQLLGAVDRAKELDDAPLMAITQCAQANIAQEAANVGKSLGSLGRLLGLVNLFMGMVGGPTVPDLSSIAGKPLDQVLPPLDALVDALGTARAAIPVP